MITTLISRKPPQKSIKSYKISNQWIQFTFHTQSKSKIQCLSPSKWNLMGLLRIMTLILAIMSLSSLQRIWWKTKIFCLILTSINHKVQHNNQHRINSRQQNHNNSNNSNNNTRLHNSNNTRLKLVHLLLRF